MKEYRNKIDEIDKRLKDVLRERFKTVKEIGIYKKENNIDIESRTRELEILNNVKGEFSEYIKNIYEEIFKESKNMQEKL